MLKLLKTLFASPLWRYHQEARVELIEARLGALTERFNRLQSREGMRQARAAKEVDQSLEDEVKSLLGDSGASEEPRQVAPEKLQLWKRRAK